MAAGKTIYPAPQNIFAALQHTPLSEVRVVILGQDPYPTAGKADGFAFSVPPGVHVPCSLCNIFTELDNDLGLPRPKGGSLIPWARSGVLLLNSVLTVEEGKRKSHARNGWEAFTDEVIYAVNEQAPHAVFMLWGREAQKKAKFVDTSRHLILSSSHPAFLSARTGTTPFLGSKPFSKADTFLRDHGLDEIKWSLRGISN